MEYKMENVPVPTELAEIIRREVIEEVARRAEAQTSELKGTHNEYLGDYNEPPAFGGVYQIGDGGLVSEARMNEVFATDAERDFWMCCMNFAGDGEAIGEVVAAAFRHDHAKLAELASESVNDADAMCFYTEIDKDDFTEDELAALRESKPELFVDEAQTAAGEAVTEEPACSRETGGEAR